MTCVTGSCIRDSSNAEVKKAFRSLSKHPKVTQLAFINVCRGHKKVSEGWRIYTCQTELNFKLNLDAITGKDKI